MPEEITCASRQPQPPASSISCPTADILPSPGILSAMSSAEELRPDRTLAEYALLIRAATSFLSIISPARDQHHLDVTSNKLTKRMDKLSLLLLTRPTPESACIVQEYTKTGTRVVALVSNAETACSSGTGSKSSARSPHLLGGARILAPGSPHATLAGHVSHLELLCRDLSTCETKIASSECIRKLQNYTHRASSPAISQRLRVPLHALTSTRFVTLFTRGTIPTSELTRHADGMDPSRLPPPPKLSSCATRRSEAKFASLLQEATGYQFRLSPSEEVTLDGEALVHYHHYVCDLMSGLDAAFVELGDVAGEDEEEAVLARIVGRVGEVNELVHYRRSFRRYIANPAFALWLRARGKETDEAHKLLPRTVRDGLVAEGVLNTREAFRRDPVRAVVRWLEGCVQWLEAVSQLRGVLHGQVGFEVVEMPAVPEVGRQVRLEELFAFCTPEVEEERDSEMEGNERGSLVTKVQDQAAWQVAHGSVAGAEWGPLTKERWDEWGTSFAGEKCCTAMMGSLLNTGDNACREETGSGERGRFASLRSELKNFPPMIGMFKKCCYTCNIYLKLCFGDGFNFKGTTGKMCPWVFPEWDTRKDIAKDLAHSLGMEVKEGLTRINPPTYEEEHYWSASSLDKSD